MTQGSPVSEPSSKAVMYKGAFKSLKMPSSAALSKLTRITSLKPRPMAPKRILESRIKVEWDDSIYEPLETADSALHAEAERERLNLVRQNDMDDEAAGDYVEPGGIEPADASETWPQGHRRPHPAMTSTAL
jgi:hypothetical protein